MKIHDVIQGSQEWLDLRDRFFTASEAPAMMGASKYQSRDDLLKQCAIGASETISSAQQSLFDKGHATEAAIRPHIEKLLGEDLYPVTGSSGELLASFDGITMDEDIVFEHKLYNESLAAKVMAGDLEPHYYWQLEQQLLVSGAQKAIFVISDGTPDKIAHMWYEPVPGRAEQILRGWEQFKKDLDAYVPTEIKVEVVAAVQEALPSPWAEVKGEIAITDNLKVFGLALTAYVKNINLKPQTDQEFADLDAACKKLTDAEEKLKLCEESALAKIESVADLRALIGEYRQIARQARLVGEKAVKAEKENRKNAIVLQAQEALRAEIAKANREFLPITISGIEADFYGATKGLKTISSMESKCNDELARAKISLTERRDHVRASIKIVNDVGADYKFLFSDLQQLVDKSHDHLKLIVKQRVDEHEAAQKRKIEEEAQRRAQQIAAQERAEAARKEQEHLEEERKREAALAPAQPLVTEAKHELRAAHVAPIEQPKPRVVSTGQAQAFRPTDDAIIDLIASHFRVNEFKAIEWIQSMNLDSATQRLARG